MESSLLAGLAAVSPIGLFACAPDGRLAWCNDRTIELWGGEQVSGLRWLDAVVPEDRERLLAGVRDARRVHRRFDVAFRIRTRRGGERTIRIHVAPIDGDDETWTGAVEDVTAQRAALAELEDREAQLRLVADHSSDLITRHDAEGRYLWVSPASRTVVGREPDAMVGQDPYTMGIMFEAERRRVDEAARAARVDGVAKRVTYPARHADGHDLWLETTLAPVEDSGHVVCVTRDVTDRRRVEAELEHRALHDELTGLPNRTLFGDRLTGALMRARRSGRVLAVLFLDLDRFKVVNDSLGHAAGDRLLVDVARRLTAALRRGDTLARFGGDELTILVEDLADEDDAGWAVERVQAAMREPFRLADGEVGLQASIGVAVCRGGEGSADGLLRDADAAMYRAKARGRDRVEVFDADLRREAQERLSVERGLRPAVAGDELRLHYQPIVRLPGGEVSAFEALVRWQHPERGWLGPAQFVPVAEEIGAIAGLGAWVLDTACAQLAAWRADGAEVGMGVNVAAAQLAQSDFVAEVAATLERHAIPPERIVLELTESAVMDQGPEVLHELSALGVRLTLDDFGTGYSSLAHLREFPLDGLKVDRTFVAGLGESAQDEAIVEAIVFLAEAMGLSTVAEGVETVEQMQAAVRLGCGFGQGFGFGRPLSAAQASALIGDRLAIA